MIIKLIKPVEHKGELIREIEINTDVTGHAEKILLSRETNRAKIMNKFLATQIKDTVPSLNLSDIDKYNLVKKISVLEIKYALYNLYRHFREGILHLDFEYYSHDGSRKTYVGDVELPEVSINEFNLDPIEFTSSKPIKVFDEEYSDFVLYPVTGAFSETLNKEDNFADMNTLFIAKNAKTKCGKVIPFDIAEGLNIKLRNEFRNNFNKFDDFIPKVELEDGADKFDHPVDLLDFFT